VIKIIFSCGPCDTAVVTAGVNDGRRVETLLFRRGSSKLYRLCVEGKSLLRVRHETLYAEQPNRISRPTSGGLDSVYVSLSHYAILYHIPRYNLVTASVWEDELRGDGKSTLYLYNIIFTYYIHYTFIKYIMYSTHWDE
jgi:hypothetical protein